MLILKRHILIVDFKLSNLTLVSGGTSWQAAFTSSKLKGLASVISGQSDQHVMKIKTEIYNNQKLLFDYERCKLKSRLCVSDVSLRQKLKM